MIDKKEQNEDAKLEKIPREIADAIDRRDLVIFVGAGVSTLYGLPNWTDVANKLVDCCHTLKCVSLEQRDLYRALHDNREKITLVYVAFKSKSCEDLFYKELENLLSEKSNFKDSKWIMEFIKDSYSTIITTNVDKILDEYCFGGDSDRIFYNIKDFDESAYNYPSIVHIHGSLNDEGSLIFTLPNYSERYMDDNFRTFITKLFNEKTVLFIGYGLKELELLAHIAHSSRKSKLHYALIPYEKTKECLCELYDEFYKQLNIKQIPYLIGNGNYARINDILRNWLNNLSETRTPQYIISEAQSYADKYPSEESIKEIKRIKGISKNAFEIFLRRLIESKHGMEWIKALFDFIFTCTEKQYELGDNIEDDNTINISLNHGFTTFSSIFEENPEDDELSKMAASLLDIIISYSMNDSRFKDNPYIIFNYVKIIARLPKVFLSDKYADYLSEINFKSIEYCLSPITDKNNYVDEWSNHNKEILFKMIMENAEKNNSAHYFMNNFLGNHLKSFIESIPKQIFDYSIKKIQLEIANNIYIYSNLGSITVYPDSYGEPERDYHHSFSSSLIDIVKQSSLKLSTNEKKSFIEKHYSDNKVSKKVSFLLITDTPELHYLLQKESKKYLDDIDICADLYHWIKNNFEQFKQNFVDLLVSNIITSAFSLEGEQQYAEMIRKCLLYRLRERSVDAKYYCESDLEEVELAVQKGDPYNVGKMSYVLKDSSYFDEEKELVWDLSSKTTDELVRVISDDGISFPNYESDIIKIKALNIHLENLSDEQIIDSIKQFENLSSNYKSRVADRISRIKIEAKEKQNIGKILEFLTEIITPDTAGWDGFNSLTAVDNLSKNLKDEELIFLINDLLSKAKRFNVGNEGWSLKRSFNYYDKFFDSLFLLCYHKKTDSLIMKQLFVTTSEILEDKFNWQIRSIIYRLKWPLASISNYDDSELKKEFYNNLFEADSSIQNICFCEMLRNYCDNDEIIRKLLECNNMFNIICDSTMDDRTIRDMKRRIGNFVAHIDLNNLLSNEQVKEMLEEFCSIIDGTMLSGYLEIANKFDNIDEFLIKIRFVLDNVYTRDDFKDIVMCTEYHLLFIHVFKINNPNNTEWVFLETYAHNEEISYSAIKDVLDKYARTVHEGRVLKILESFTSNNGHISSIYEENFINIVNKSDSSEHSGLRNQIRNNLCKYGKTNLAELF